MCKMPEREQFCFWKKGSHFVVYFIYLRDYSKTIIRQEFDLL